MIITKESIENKETQREVIREIQNLMKTIISTSYPNTDVFDLKLKLTKINRVKEEEYY